MGRGDAIDAGAPPLRLPAAAAPVATPGWPPALVEGTMDFPSASGPPVHLDFVVDDITEAARRAMDAGAIQQSDCVQWRGSKCITFADPFGNGFCLIEFTAETYADEA
jgi:predicted enzyme related to lactoylglutathione lyase